MSLPGHREEDLRASLREAHEALDPPAPSFERLWQRARQDATSSRRSPRRNLSWSSPGVRPGFALAALVAVLAAALILPRWDTFKPGPPPEQPLSIAEEEVLRFAEELSTWASSLEFLDRAPDLDLYDSFPQIYRLPREFDEPFHFDSSTAPPEAESDIKLYPLPPAGLGLRPV